jgi:MoaA/NifB/PqqE/SkfB family radical SAM enzyme
MTSVRSLVPRRTRTRLRGWQLKVARRGHEPRPPVTPVGVKMELTWRCNLRCGFCYTDSPRHTLARTPDLPDEAWLGLVDDVLELGIVEAVVTGGEPLLRRDLALDVIDRLSRAGVAVVLNTNGWFVDEAVADRLARAPGLRVFVSIDGAVPALHDAARGVPGSWNRATGAAHLLLERGVHVEVPHVVTPDNVEHLPAFLSCMASLGVDGVAVTPVQKVGAAARSARWSVDRRGVEGAVRAFRRSCGERPAVTVRGEVSHVLDAYEQRVPRSMLLRPNGDVRRESIMPFVFGNALRDGVAECWEQIRTRWNEPDLRRWARESSRGDLHEASLVAYRDADVDLGGGTREGALALDSPEPAPVPQAPVTVRDLAESRASLARLAASRRYRLGDVRWAEDVDGARLVRVPATGAKVRLNSTAGVVMDACAGGTLADATARLVACYPGEDPARLARDAAGSINRLVGDRIIRPALAP